MKGSNFSVATVLFLSCYLFPIDYHVFSFIDLHKICFYLHKTCFYTIFILYFFS